MTTQVKLILQAEVLSHIDSQGIHFTWEDMNLWFNPTETQEANALEEYQTLITRYRNVKLVRQTTTKNVVEVEVASE